MDLDRIAPSDAMSELLAATLAVYSIPSRPVEAADALAVCRGLGEEWRTLSALRKWGEGRGRLLLLAGTNPNERTHLSLNLAALAEEPFNLRRTDGVYCQEIAAHTKAQAEWLAGMTQELYITSIALFVSPYHLLRAYLTLLKTFIKRGIQIPIIPRSVPIPPATPIPEHGGTQWDAVPAEMHRIFKYQEKGDVATFEELGSYINWLWEQPLLKIN